MAAGAEQPSRSRYYSTSPRQSNAKPSRAVERAQAPLAKAISSAGVTAQPGESWRRAHGQPWQCWRPLAPSVLGDARPSQASYASQGRGWLSLGLRNSNRSVAEELELAKLIGVVYIREFCTARLFDGLCVFLFACTSCATGWVVEFLHCPRSASSRPARSPSLLISRRIQSLLTSSTHEFFY